MIKQLIGVGLFAFLIFTLIKHGLDPEDFYSPRHLIALIGSLAALSFYFYYQYQISIGFSVAHLAPPNWHFGFIFLDYPVASDGTHQPLSFTCARNSGLCDWGTIYRLSRKSGSSTSLAKVARFCRLCCRDLLCLFCSH